MDLRVLARADAFVLSSWKNVVVLFLRSNVTLALIADLRRGYVRMLDEHPMMISLVCIHMLQMPKLGAAERAALSELSTLTEGRAVAVQWTDGEGLIAAAARAIVAAQRLLGLAHNATASDCDGAIDYVLAHTDGSVTRDDLRRCINQTRALFPASLSLH